MTSVITREDQHTSETSAPDVMPTPERAGAITTPLHIAHELSEPWLALTALVALGGISGVAYYLGFVRPYLLADYYARPLLDLAKINGHTGPSANAWGFTWLVLFACYYFAFRLCPPAEGVTRFFRRTTLFLICVWAAFFAINLIFMYPVGAADIFDQIFRARLTAHYDFNPFITIPSSLAGDPFQPYVAWTGDPSPYGPLWEVLAAGTSLLGGDGLWRNLILFKTLVTAAYGVSVALTYGILRVVKPEWALRGALFFAWNPLVLFEVAGNGHNDAIVIMFVLAAVYLFVLAKRFAVIPALVAGALTKFVPIILLPVAAVAIWRDRLRVRKRRRDGEEELAGLTNYDALMALAIGAALSLGLALILYAPFWTGLDGILPRNRSALFTSSIPKVALDALVYEAGVSEGWAQWIVRNAAYAIVMFVTLGLTFYVFWSRNATTSVSRATLVNRTLMSFYEIIFVYLAVASLWFQPWYLMWLVALTAPVARMVNVHRTLLFCIGGIANYFVWDYLWLWNRTDIRTIQITSALVVYTLPLLYTLYVWLRPSFEKLEIRN